MNNFTANYRKILDTLQLIESKMNFLNQKRKPKLLDIELVAIDLTSEYMGIDSEYQLFRSLPLILSTRIERSVYNRRKRGLFFHREELRTQLSSHVLSDTDCLIVDSMPLEVCKLSRSSRSSICKENYSTAPSKGYCASQKMHYYGYKLHAVCTTSGVFTSFDLTQASVHDIHYLKDIKEMYQNCTILGNKGYLSVDYQRDLFSSSNTHWKFRCV